MRVKLAVLGTAIILGGAVSGMSDGNGKALADDPIPVGGNRCTACTFEITPPPVAPTPVTPPWTV